MHIDQRQIMNWPLVDNFEAKKYDVFTKIALKRQNYFLSTTTTMTVCHNPLEHVYESLWENGTF